ncbi:MAG: 3-phosphoshikimate 1-carboxyvinyltransferase [Phycisphaerae bacterium]
MQWIDGNAHLHPSSGPVDAAVDIPGSKSLTNRYLLCLALADGASTLRNASPSDDAARMLACLHALQIETRVSANDNTILVRGCAGHFRATNAALDVHDAGTVMRFCTALCTLGYGEYLIDGSARMRARPIGDEVEALRRLGCGIEYLQEEDYPPLLVRAAGLAGGHVIPDVSKSSQYLSALLMVSPYAANDTFLELNGELPSRPYVQMTLDVMSEMGVTVIHDGAESERFIVAAPQSYQPGNYFVEPDASGATYFWALAAATGGRVRVNGLTRKSRQGDVHFVDVLAQMGCSVVEGAEFLEIVGPPRGQLRGVNVDLNTMPDTVQTLAVLALFANGKTEIRNVANLRIKETDRLSALGAELGRVGATVDVHRDGITIYPPREFISATIETYNDHRMAMSFAVAGKLIPDIVIRDAGCVSKSFPGFFPLLEAVAPSVE